MPQWSLHCGPLPSSPRSPPPFFFYFGVWAWYAPKTQQNQLILGNRSQLDGALFARRSWGQDKEDTKTLLEEILAVCVECRTYAGSGSKQNMWGRWKLLLSLVVPFPIPSPSCFPLRVIHHVTRADRNTVISAGEEGANWYGEPREPSWYWQGLEYYV